MLRRMSATVCFSPEGDYVLTFSLPREGRRQFSTENRDGLGRFASIEHVGGFAQMRGTDLFHLVNLARSSWLPMLSSIDALAQIDMGGA